MSQPLVLGTDYGDHLTIEVLGRMHAGSRDFWDDNWMVSPITLRIGGFAGRIEAGLRMDELVGLRVGLEKLLNGLGAAAELESLEPWLRLQVSFDRDLGLTARGEAVADPSSGTKLVFRLEGLKEPALRVVVDQLRAIEVEFPVVDGDS
jgi:hypothetical protein